MVQFLVMSLFLMVGQGDEDQARAAIAIAQAQASYQAPAVVKPSPTPTPIKPEPSSKSPYMIALNSALENDKLLLIYVGGPLTNRAGSVSVQVSRLEGYPVKCLVLSIPLNGEMVWKATLPLDATNAQIDKAFKGVSQPADPFGDPFSGSNKRLARRTADDSPWLAVSEQKKVRDMWPDGVPLPDTLKFYKLAPASQSVAAFGYPGAGNNHRFVPPSIGDENPNREFPWIGSGGMDHARKGTWRNVTGMSIPNGTNIEAWRAPMEVKNSFGSIQHEVAVHWQFPSGTQMFDVLIRKNDDGTEHIFNIRRRVKGDTGWDDGASFLPDIDTDSISTFEVSGTSRTKRVLGVSLIKHRVVTVNEIKAKPKFKEANEATVAMNDGGHYFPQGFIGAGMSCNKCHNGAVHESKDYGGPLLRGKDTVFSWYPIRTNLVIDSVGLPTSVADAAYVPAMDNRWPLAYLGRK